MNHLTIRDTDDLARLLRGSGTWRSIAVEVDGLSEERSRQLAEALARGERPCGCVGARRGAAAGLIAGAALCLSGAGIPLWLLPPSLALLASLIGYRLDIAWARRARRRATQALAAHLDVGTVFATRLTSTSAPPPSDRPWATNRRVRSAS